MNLLHSSGMKVFLSKITVPISHCLSVSATTRQMGPEGSTGALTCLSVSLQKKHSGVFEATSN